MVVLNRGPYTTFLMGSWWNPPRVIGRVDANGGYSLFGLLNWCTFVRNVSCSVKSLYPYVIMLMYLLTYFDMFIIKTWHVSLETMKSSSDLVHVFDRSNHMKLWGVASSPIPSPPKKTPFFLEVSGGNFLCFESRRLTQPASMKHHFLHRAFKPR